MRFQPVLWIPITIAVAAALASAPRFGTWKVVGPGGGGGNFYPTISPHDSKRVLIACDMTGSFISHDGGESWRMFNLGNRTDLFAFDPSNPDVIYAKTGGPPDVMAKDRPVTMSGLFRSSDAGKSWRLVRADGAHGTLKALAIDPTKSNILFAAVERAGKEFLQTSTDSGKTWDAGSPIESGTQVISADPNSPVADRTVYVMGTQAVAIRESGEWAAGAALPARGQFAMGFPKQGAPIVYGISGSEVHVSEDGGRQWRKSNVPGLVSPRLRAVATSLYHPDTAYVSYSNSDGWHGVAKTSDRGKTWSLVWKESNSAADNIRDAWLTQRFGPRWGGSPGQLGVAPHDPRICYGTDSGRTMRTTDGGETWTGVYSRKQPSGAWSTTGLDVTTAYGVHFDPFDPKRMFISYTDIGLFGSQDAGKTWFSATTGVPQPWTNTTYWIAFDPEVRGRVWGAMAGAHDLPRPKMWLNRPKLEYPGGVCRSNDGGMTWATSNQGMPLTATTHIIVDPRSPKNSRTLYATGFATGVYKSTDDGATWSLKNKGIAGTEPFAWRLAMDRAGVLYLIVARRSDDGSIGGPGDGALYRSTDGAENWTRVALPADVNGPHGLAIDPTDARRLYLAAWGRRPADQTIGGGIFLSTDAGATWKHVLAGDQHVYDITIDERDPKVLYSTGFEASAWRSQDRGEHWKRLSGFNFKWGHRVIPDPLDRSRIYVTTYGGSVWHGPAAGDPGSPEDITTR